MRQRQSEYCAADLERLPRGYHLGVLSVNGRENQQSNIALRPGDVIRIKGVKGNDPTAIISCEKLEDNGKMSVIQFPSSIYAVFRELIPQGVSAKNVLTNGQDENCCTVRDLQTRLLEGAEGPLEVELVKYGPDHRSPDTDIPLMVPILMREVIMEPAVFASVQSPSAPAFHIPMRTLIYLKLVNFFLFCMLYQKIYIT